MDQPANTSVNPKQSAAEASLQSFFEMFVRRERTQQELIRNLVSVCTQEPHATWQALSLMDQYHRRGVLPTTFYRELKKELNAIAFGNAGTHVSRDGKTFAHAMNAGTAKLGATERRPSSSQTVSMTLGSLDPSRLDVPSPTRSDKTIMLDLEFAEDIEKTVMQGPASQSSSTIARKGPQDRSSDKTSILAQQPSSAKTKSTSADATSVMRNDAAFAPRTAIDPQRLKNQNAQSDATSIMPKDSTAYAPRTMIDPQRTNRTEQTSTPPSSNKTAAEKADATSLMPRDNTAFAPRTIVDPQCPDVTVESAAPKTAIDANRTSTSLKDSVIPIAPPKVDTVFTPRTEITPPADTRDAPSIAANRPPTYVPAEDESDQDIIDPETFEPVKAQRREPIPVDPPRIVPLNYEPTRVDPTVVDIAELPSQSMEQAPEALAPEPPLQSIEPIKHTGPRVTAPPISIPAVRAPLESQPMPESTPARGIYRVGVKLDERYVLVEPVTSGNISMVFKAFDNQRGSLPELERFVAIKCPHANLHNDPRARAAFRHEYEQSQTILHPNIAKIYDLYDTDQQCFIVMELLQGEPLDRLLERISPRRLPLPRALAIVREIGLALAHAHDHGVVHGNLQASNVTLMRNGEIRVSDFAQSAGWLPPDAAKAQASDDLYSLACIAHEVLCGCLPESDPPEQKPRYAKHLSVQQWKALRSGLAEDNTAGAAASGRKTNFIKRWLAELDLRTAEIRLPDLAVMESELAGRRTQTTRTSMSWPMIAGAGLAGVIVIAALFIVLRGALNTPTPAPAQNNNSIAEQMKNSATPDAVSDPVATAWATASSSSPATTDSPTTPSSATDSQAPAANIAQLPTVSFTAERYEVSEQEGVARLLIQRSEPLDRKLQLRWFTIPGSAQPGVDYVGYQYASVQLQPGQQSVEIAIPLIQGSRHGRDVSFDVRISATGNALPGRAVVAKVVILPAM